MFFTSSHKTTQINLIYHEQSQTCTGSKIFIKLKKKEVITNKSEYRKL